MDDCEHIGSKELRRRDRKSKSRKCKDRKNSKDDLGGMMISMTKKIDIRELFILWALFIFLHTEMFVDCILKRFKNATNDDKSMRMKGTFIASMLMVIAIVVCSIIF